MADRNPVALPRGTHHCKVQFHYLLTATECSLKTCQLDRLRANVFAAAQPDQRLGFDLVVP